MSTASRGRRREHLVRAELERHGFHVLRSAASKGPADLIAIRTAVVCVQVKPDTDALTPALRRRLIALADAVGAGLGVPVVATKPLGLPISWRFLTGEGPDEWLPWQPDRTEAAA